MSTGPATLTTGTSGTNEITYEAVTPGVAGNDITIAYTEDTPGSALIVISVTGTDISVEMADAGSVISSTAAEVVAAINADADAKLLVTASGTDTGLMVTMEATNLNTSLTEVQFNVGLTIQGGEKVDINSVVINYFDKDMHAENVDWTGARSAGSTERGAASLLEEDEIFVVSVTIPGAASLGAYDNFTLQVIPPTGATITLQRTLPGGISAVMDLQ